ncbi:hypothetical protein [Actinacidiphila sp. bgisy160]|uniref:hypothetical protein n=1 Tax=Actinacidiphila sp. bgisy160 TaxID=3413796 RepID=UPI003D71696C
MAFSMSTGRDTRLGRATGPQTVRLYGSDADGGKDGFPVVIGRGTVRVNPDGPESCTVYDDEGRAYEPVGTSWEPLAREWTCEARRIDQDGQGDL